MMRATWRRSGAIALLAGALLAGLLAVPTPVGAVAGVHVDPDECCESLDLGTVTHEDVAAEGGPIVRYTATSYTSYNAPTSIFYWHLDFDDGGMFGFEGTDASVEAYLSEGAWVVTVYRDIFGDGEVMATGTGSLVDRTLTVEFPLEALIDSGLGARDHYRYYLVAENFPPPHAIHELDHVPDQPVPEEPTVGLLHQLSVGARAATADFDGDRTSDVAVYRPSAQAWFVQDGPATGWGAADDVPIVGDFNGDGFADPAVFRPSDQTWHVQPNHGWAGLSTQWGVAGDVPVPADFDGDGSDEIAVFRPSDQTWYAQGVGGLATQWGVPGDVPVPADFDGDGDEDVAVFRPSDQTWYAQGVGGLATQWGVPGDVPVPADYDGDGADEVAVFRPSDQTWYAQGLGGLATQWGIDGDRPVPADYDGDGDDDVAVFRPGDATWYVQGPAGLATQWGTAGDLPVVVPAAVRALSG
jgi:hypothetical protein